MMQFLVPAIIGEPQNSNLTAYLTINGFKRLNYGLITILAARDAIRQGDNSIGWRILACSDIKNRLVSNQATRYNGRDRNFLELNCIEGWRSVVMKLWSRRKKKSDSEISEVREVGAVSGSEAPVIDPFSPSLSSESANNDSVSGLSAYRYVIPRGMTFSGNLFWVGPVQVDGEFQGTISSSDGIWVRSSGVIEGDMICEDSIVDGAVLGSVNASKAVKLRAGCNVDGEIIGGVLTVLNGAELRTRVKVAV